MSIYPDSVHMNDDEDDGEDGMQATLYFDAIDYDFLLQVVERTRLIGGLGFDLNRLDNIIFTLTQAFGHPARKYIERTGRYLSEDLPTPHQQLRAYVREVAGRRREP